MTKILIKYLEESKMIEEVITNIGVPQGDCLSPILFMILVRAEKEAALACHMTRV